ncbi:MAG: TPM domain-containing protein [Bacilli bacterium]|nr:TPM domain-containing protein [Bacilli bacterium]
MKKIFNIVFIVLLTLLCTVNVYASTNTYDRNELENYGVNKNVQDINSKLSYIMNTKKVDASEKIYDFSDILTDEEEQLLKAKIDKFIEDNNMDMVIVTDNFAYTNDIKNQEYADDFYDYNDFGLNIEYYSGVLLLRNTYSLDPYYHMSTSGNAQLYLNDYRVNRILDDIYYDIHNGNYYEGFSKWITYTDNYIKEGYPSTASNYYLDNNGNMHRVKPKYHPPIGIAFLAGFVVALTIVLVMVSKNKMVKKAQKAGEYIDQNSINITKREDTFLRSHTSSYTVSSSSGSHHGGGGHSFHSGSSGFSHGGGGRHG